MAPASITVPPTQLSPFYVAFWVRFYDGDQSQSTPDYPRSRVEQEPWVIYAHVMVENRPSLPQKHDQTNLFSLSDYFTSRAGKFSKIVELINC